MSDSKQSDTPKISELTTKELDALITRLEEAIEFDLALSHDDIRLLLSALLKLATMQESLSNKKITLHKLRKVVGMVQSSEKLSDLVNEKIRANKHKVPRNKKPKKKNTVSPDKIHHQLNTPNKGICVLNVNAFMSHSYRRWNGCRSVIS